MSWGCSGSSTADGGGIGGTGVVSRGSITELGSVLVNGILFVTSAATIIVEGEEKGVGDVAALENLDIGRVVTVNGTRNEDGTTGTADQVVYSDDIEGPVESLVDIDATTKEIGVLGQAVIVNARTEFKGTAFATIALDDVVAASGLFDATGAIRATFLEKTGDFAPGVVVDAKGFVENVDPGQETFEINDLTVDYSSADTSGLPEDVPANGLFVDVDGTLDSIGGDMLATKISLEDALGVEDADRVELSGFVTDFVSVLEFTVGNQRVFTDENTAFENGRPDNTALGVKLEVEGRLVGGVVFAEEIEFWDADHVELIGFVTDFVSVFEFTVENQVVQTDVDTLFTDGTPDDIVLGAKLEVEGRLVEGVLFAMEVEFWDPDQIEVEGLVTDFVSAFEFTVGEQAVQTDESTVFEGGTPGDVALGVTLEVKGRLAGDILVADRVSFEEDEV
jgi:hypothetical protein